MTVPDEQLLHYVEDFGLYFEQFGLARTAGRMLGWLLVCDPPHQTMDELVEALQVSKSSISTMSRLLIHIGLVSKVSFPGERKDYYRVGEYAWIQGWETKNNQTNQMKQMAARGLALLPEEATERRERLQEMYDLYAFLEAELPKLTQRWLESRQKS
ncbi:MAG: MarR family transcriptional regulator [Ardenticatenaceae bacterium]|nr:MarR family transcriptional regulator [Ardenticatenaceae bacterium]MCB8950016.1 MarR family transcriptional regulator [Ardenticatenaceae bacterium]